MNAAELALISQILALVMQGVTSAITLRKQLGDNASQQEQANLAQAHTNFQAITAAANTALGQ